MWWVKMIWQLVLFKLKEYWTNSLTYCKFLLYITQMKEGYLIEQKDETEGMFNM